MFILVQALRFILIDLKKVKIQLADSEQVHAFAAQWLGKALKREFGVLGLF
jgi:hypothetical protein